MVIVLAIGGIIAILLGVLCFPNRAINPKAIGSLFVVEASFGAYIETSRLLFAIGGCLMACSFALKYAIRKLFREG